VRWLIDECLDANLVTPCAWPVVTQALKDYEFSDTNIRNILGDNVLRLMERVIGS
jgi:microsomal dipeptidase-like Zn-dependent dipeptidase